MYDGKRDDGDQQTEYRAICLWKAEFKGSTQKYPNEKKAKKDNETKKQIKTKALTLTLVTVICKNFFTHLKIENRKDTDRTIKSDIGQCSQLLQFSFRRQL